MTPHIDPYEAGEAPSGDVLADLGFGVHEPAGSFVDGNRVTPGTEGCVCTSECEFPCWQRLGMTTHPCCKGCAPLPEES